jgi:5-formyltetrahydrofolate cyclo-ligase
MVVPPTALNILRKQLRKHLTVSLVDVLHAAHCIGLYLPVGGEPDPSPLLNGCAAMASLPNLSAGSASMTFRRWTTGDPLMTSVWGGQQPTDAAPVVIPDLILVPLLGFDAAFNRIGQGGGHYDRYLAAHPNACRIGIAWEGQRVDNIDPQPWDVPLDAILTETAFHVKDLTRCQRP